MTILSRQEENGNIIEVEGFFSIDKQDDFIHLVDESIIEKKHVIIDLSKTRFIDSSSLGLIIRMNERTNQEGLRFVIINIREEIHQVFEITGLINRLNIVDSLEAAVNFVESK
ncbi:STAS domain-containing protein [Spirochaetota bacterium]